MSRLFVVCSVFLFVFVSVTSRADDSPGESKFPFKAPFHVENSTIYDKDGRKVKLWGVNYLAPFNHNYVNIEESGVYHSTTIDKDMDHFELMGVDFIRVHLYDREITDARGTLVENKHLKVFDYLVDQAHKRGIFLMLTPVVWWNTVENEVLFRKGYAYWDLTQQPNFGFSNYFAKHAVLWHPEAIECQKRYLKALFEHKNAYSGKRLCDYENIVVIELTNEPQYVHEGNIDHEPKMGSDLFRGGPGPRHLEKRYEAFAERQGEGKTRKESMPAFRGEILSRYFAELWPVVDECFGNRVLKSHIEYDFDNPHVIKAFRDHHVDAVNVVSYLLAKGKFDGGNTDWANFLDHASGWLERHQKRNWQGFPKIVYEYGAASSLDGYVLGAFAASFRRAGVQMAAFFTYTPSSVAGYNPGWLIHYLNLEHTPNKAAAFAAAGEIFRGEISPDELKRDRGRWSGPGFEIVGKPSNVDYCNGDVFRYADSTKRKIADVSKLKTISGRGNSAVAESGGSGSYFLKKLDEKKWELHLFANEKIMNDPAGAQTFRHMANRYMNINDIPVVSRLLDEPIRFNFKIGKVVNCETEQETRPPRPVGNGIWELFPGRYILELE